MHYRRHRRARNYRGLIRRARLALVALAAWPALQVPGCIPDPVGALNFELQNFFNVTLINAVNVIVQNLFRI
jgi:hypothetical protein